MARRLAFVLLGCCLLAPASAGAVVTVGNNLAADPGGGLSSSCGAGTDCSTTYLVSQLPPAAAAAGGVASPISGVVVRCRIKTIVGTDAPSDARLRLAFDAGGGAFVGDGTGTANGTATYSGRLAATVTVAIGTANSAKPGRVKLKLTFTEKARKSLARKKRVRLTLKVVVGDRSGNLTTTTKRIQLKR